MKAKYPSWEPGYRRKWHAAYRARNADKLKEWHAADYHKNKERYRSRARAYYQKNRDKIKAAVAAYQKAHPEAKNASKRKRYAEAHEHFIAKSRSYSAKRKATGKSAAYRDRTRDKQRAWARARSALAGDAYARELLSKYSPISAKDWPQELVEAKKLEIQINRQIRKTA